MKVYTLDTNIIAYLMKGMHGLEDRLSSVIDTGDKIIINPVSYYEICRGLLAINSQKKLETFINLCEVFGVAELKKGTLFRAAEIYSDLKIKGEIVEDADIFIAALCLENDYILVTNNVKHFDRINGLKIENWVAGG